ncbi:FtsX-like permease family protein [Rhizobium sp. SL86]|uniref:FtsX-like permease family protein n=1 Tax=Rhizobium sp. SL86 TaxID=2995148 RepID=UPI00227388D7|nr:FtsX-like permease family protein [Rhizobium sp. SL86]MCY1668163.1 FtsX-like permease family protein [Rhizobium sp. SL86]
MSYILGKLFGRLPIGWLQLRHNPARLAAALAGVAFANMLVFVQLGILGVLNGTIKTSYDPIVSDIMISSYDSNTLTEGSSVSRRLLFRALSVPGISAAAPLYMGKLDWKRADGNTVNLMVYALPIEAGSFAGPQVQPALARLTPSDHVLIDRSIRGVDPQELAGVTQQTPYRFEVQDRTVTAVGTLGVGAGFSADGVIFASDQTFLSLFPKRIGGTPSHILLQVEDKKAIPALVAQLREMLKDEPVLVRSTADAIADDVRYQTTERPTGVIFGFGVFMGVLVGIVIVYQVLSTDVADHLKEYATLKAMGYPQRFFFGIVLEEALVLGLLGFVPGFLLSNLVYGFLSGVTALPVEMNLQRAVMVLVGTLAASVISGTLATRRLNGADPADLF